MTTKNEVLNYFIFDPNGRVLEYHTQYKSFEEKALSKKNLPEEILRKILSNEEKTPFYLKVTDSLTLWMEYCSISSNEYQAFFLDFSQRYQYEEDIRDTNDELAESLMNSEDYRSKFEEQSEKMTATLDKLMEANEVIIQHNERINKELEMASKLQFNMLPKIYPALDNLDYASFYKPSQHIGGDIFDIVETDRKKVLAVIADVSGHGVSASLVTAMFKMAFNYHAALMDDPAELMNSLNKELNKNIDQNFITSFMCLLDIENNLLTYSNAGHPSMYLVKPDNDFELLSSTGMMLGLFEEEEYENRRTRFSKDDKLYMFTDGIVEAENPKNEIYTLPRLEESILNNNHLETEKIKEQLYDDLVRFTQNRPFDDDITLLIIKRK